jgi:tetratricopeptide (TPR) repeat protein
MVLHERGCPHAIATTITQAAQGNVLYALLSCQLVQQGIVDSTALEPGLDFLYQTWWQGLDEQGKHLALLLAAAGKPMPMDLANELLAQDTRPLLNAWQKIGLLSQEQTSVYFAHSSLPLAIARSDPAGIIQAHTAVVDLARGGGERGIASDEAIRNPPMHRDDATNYLLGQMIRHAACANAQVRETIVPMVTERAWLRYRQRMDGSLTGAFADVLWELQAALDTIPHIAKHDSQAPQAPQAPQAIADHLVRIGRDVVVASTLASLTRSLPPETVVAALEIAREQLGRDQSLKRVQEMVDQLPDGADKAQVLRQMGESCYAAAMRNSAMRLLSQALDLEEQRVPPSWNDQRDQLLIVLVETALQAGNVEAALAICESIAHKEQRGMAETQVVRWLVRHGELVRARKVATAIVHESLTAWAQAEVVVAVARKGDTYNAELLLGDITVETAAAWAQIELACDDACNDVTAAQERLQNLASTNQQDHGFARLVEALAQANQYDALFAAAKRITDVSVRVQALIQLRDVLDHRGQEQAVMLQALKQADSTLGELAEDMRVSLVALLAAAYAALGFREEAYGVATQLPEGEERDRALSRIAVALIQHGDYAEGLTVARALADDDERDWTLAEVTQVLADHGHWQEAQARAMEIVDERDRARTLANLAIAMARLGSPLGGLQLTHKINRAGQQGRALVFIAPLLVQSGYVPDALRVFEDEYRRYAAGEDDALTFVQLYRYLAAIAVALAEQGDIPQALEVCQRLPESVEQGRVYLSIARAAAKHDPGSGYAAFGKAMRFAAIDRGDGFRLLEQAVPVMAAWGGADMLVRLAGVVSDVDSWIV